MKGEGAKLFIFEHTVREVEGVLDGAAANYRTGARGDHFPGDVVDYFASESLSRSDVEMLIASLDERIEEQEIEVVSTPAHSEGLNVPEGELENALKAGIHYGRQEALVKDLNSLTAVHRLREGEVRRRFERCGALFVTTNTQLAHVSKEFFRDHYGRSGVPLCMSDAALAALAWLMNPTQAPDLPRRQIIATSYAALNPPDAIWRKYLTEIRRLEARGELTDQQVGLLLFSPDARLELMNATSGDADAFADGTIAQVLQHAEAATRAEVEDELTEERARREKAEATIGAEQARAEDEARKAREIAEAHADRLGLVARRIACGASWAIFAIVTLLVTVGTAAASQGLFPSSWSRAVPFTSALIALAVIGGLASFVFGWNLLDLRRWTAKRVEPPVDRKIRRWFGPKYEAEQ